MLTFYEVGLMFYFYLMNVNSLSIAKCSKNDTLKAILNTKTGKVKGLCDHVRVYDENISRDMNVYSFLGIPYANPPIHHNRFEAPVPVEPWNYILDGTKWQNSCLQIDNENKFDGYKMWKPNKSISKYNEDCLYLNIWLPVDAYLRKNLRKGKFNKASIMVFMHDFDLVKGSSVLDVFDPSTFVALTGIIVITVNYRLDVYGFLHINGHINGNQALLDQNLALKWIYNNADNFGGDRTKITLAGSYMVGYHLFYKKSWNLYNNIIIHGVSVFQETLIPITSEEATNRSLEFANYIGCLSNHNLNETVECMKSKNGFDLIKASENYFFKNLLLMNKKTHTNLKTYFPLVINGNELNFLPNEAFKNNDYNKNVSVLMGFNKNEGSIIIDKSDSKQEENKIKSYNLSEFYNFLEQYYYYFPRYPSRSNKILIKKIVNEYTKQIVYRSDSVAIEKLNFFKILERLLGQESVSCAILKLAEEISRHNKAYVYLYSHRITTSPWNNEYGIVNGDELAMIFGQPVSIRSAGSNISTNPWLLINKTYPNLERQLCYQIINYWSNFINNNDPNMEHDNSVLQHGIFHWSDYKSNTKKILNFKTSNINFINYYSNDKCKFWNDLKFKNT